MPKLDLFCATIWEITGRPDDPPLLWVNLLRKIAWSSEDNGLNETSRASSRP